MFVDRSMLVQVWCLGRAEGIRYPMIFVMWVLGVRRYQISYDLSDVGAGSRTPALRKSSQCSYPLSLYSSPAPEISYEGYCQRLKISVHFFPFLYLLSL